MKRFLENDNNVWTQCNQSTENYLFIYFIVRYYFD